MRTLTCLLACGALACAAAPDDDDGEFDSFLAEGGKADTGGIQEGTEEAQAVLFYANNFGPDDMHGAAGVSATATDGILAHRNGPDGQFQSADDDPFDSLAELDAVPWVGPRTFAKILARVKALGLVGCGCPLPRSYCNADGTVSADSYTCENGGCVHHDAMTSGCDGTCDPNGQCVSDYNWLAFPQGPVDLSYGPPEVSWPDTQPQCRYVRCGGPWNCVEGSIDRYGLSGIHLSGENPGPLQVWVEHDYQKYPVSLNYSRRAEVTFKGVYDSKHWTVGVVADADKARVDWQWEIRSYSTNLGGYYVSEGEYCPEYDYPVVR